MQIVKEYFEVLRPFEGPGSRQFNRGEIVEASGFRLKDRLVEQRFLRPAPAPAVERTEIDASTQSRIATVIQRKSARRRTVIQRKSARRRG